MSRILSRLLIAAMAAGFATTATAVEFTIQPGGASQIEFVSKAPMETFGGKTKKVSGEVSLDPAQVADSIAVSVHVDMASLDTGVEMRNKHMRENHLHTAQYPDAVFTGGKLENLSARQLEEGKPVTATISGTMNLHGVEKPLQAPITMTYRGGTLHVSTQFKIKLADYSIPRPQFLVMKLDEVQAVSVELDARPKP